MTMYPRLAPLALLVLSAMLIALSGCDDIVVLDEPGGEDPQPDMVDPACTVDADCTEEGATCVDGACVTPQCTVDGDCSDGQRCTDGACVNTECLFDECPLPEPVCDEEGRRVAYTGTEITADCVCNLLEVTREVTECPEGTVCSEGECQDLCEEVVCPDSQFFCIEGTDNALSVAFTCNPGTGECEQGEAQMETCGDDRSCVDDQGCVQQCMINTDCTDEPRAPSCLDGNSFERFDFVCENNRCIESRTAGDCENPPDSCELFVAQVYNEEATCDAGECVFPEPESINCLAEDKACESGVCVDPCDVQDPCPEETCSSNFLSVQTFSGAGTCTALAGEAICDYNAQTLLNEEVCEGAEMCIEGVAGLECDIPGE